ncbi:hypothetical protein PBY51_009789 [Eleginops maclovinus]|uniref:Uncharacterized protein n=1 Tax=Eleginops maclovinus TaxID=56733 RepID=A0AAN8AV89_ELEMC|nr:hypothetical protein PBY51_009789 [Eleginops maclovinus]
MLYGVAGKEKYIAQHAWCSHLPTFLIATGASDTHASIDCGTDILVRAGLFCCCAAHQPDRSGPVKLSQPLQVVRAYCAQNLAVLCLAVTQLQSHLAFTGEVLKD